MEYHFWRRLSTEVSASTNGLALCRTGPPPPPRARDWRGGLVEPPVEAGGRAYLEIQITKLGEGEARCGALLGVTWEEKYPSQSGLHKSRRAHLFSCGNCNAVCGDEVGSREVAESGPLRRRLPPAG